MTKSDIIKSKIDRAQFHLEQADKLQQEAFGELAELGCYDIHNGIEALLQQMDEVLMEVCIPLEITSIDCSLYEAKEGDEDSFSNIDKGITL
jgi:hypothetical protein